MSTLVVSPLLQQLTQVLVGAESLTVALQQVIESVCVSTGWICGESWLATPSGAFERGPSWHAAGTPADVLVALAGDDGPDKFAARVCVSREPVWQAGFGELQQGISSAVGFPLTEANNPAGALIFYVPRAIDVTDPAFVIVQLATAQIGLWLSRRRAEEHARDVEQKFRLVVEHVQDGVLLLNTRGQIELWTVGAERLLGWASAEVHMQSASVLREPHEAAHLATELAAAALSDRIENEGWRIRKNGERFWAHVVTCRVLSTSGTVTGFAQVMRDLTEAKLAEEVKAHARKLEDSNRELEAFGSVASHDLQEPLRKILSFCDRLRGRSAAQLDEVGLGYLERVESAARRMQQLVQDLLAYARLEAPTPPPSEVDLGAVAREVLSDLAINVEESSATIELGALPIVLADATQMRQLLQNLMTNALKFKRPGEPPRVTISARALPRAAGSSWAEVTVSDHGIGFDDAYAERIFGMLTRLHPRGTYAGTGIGLAICRRIVERHGGGISATSGEGRGATFTFKLPLAESAARTQ